jgi:hypothetical protein
MSRRRLRRRSEKAQRHTAPSPAFEPELQIVVRQPDRIERLAYTRPQAAEALGIGRTTLTRLLLYIDTIETPWGTTLLAERRRPRHQRPRSKRSGRPATLPPEVIERIRTAHAGGRSYGEIARALNADRTPTAHGGKRWWPSTIRGILQRANCSC